MSVLVKMPLDCYRNFLGRFPLPCRGYAILKNSIIERTQDSSIVEMLCPIEDAKLILERANLFYPLAAPYIEDALSVVTGVEERITRIGASN